MTLQDLLKSGKSREEINAILSGQTVGTGGFYGDQATEADPLPQNYIRNNSTRTTYDLGQSQPSPAMDYTQAPVEIGGYGKGYRVKGDPMRVIMADGRIVRMGADTGADRARTLDDLKLAQTRQQLATGGIEQQIKQAELQSGKKGTVPAGYRMTADGNMEAIPGGPADLKSQQQAALKATGATDVDMAVGSLRDAYDRLAKGGGITSTENSALENVLPSIASSGVGQSVGKLFGTSNQSARNDIAMTRPALLAALMKATGMSAKQMDSNAELKLWLSTATDPTLDVESNRRALANIERKYLGASREPSAGGGLSGKDIEALQWATANPQDPRSAAIKARLGAK